MIILLKLMTVVKASKESRKTSLAFLTLLPAIFNSFSNWAPQGPLAPNESLGNWNSTVKSTLNWSMLRILQILKWKESNDDDDDEM